MFGFLTAEGFVGHFRFRGAYLPLADDVPEVHANRGTCATDFIGENVIFLPVERDGAFLTTGC